MMKRTEISVGVKPNLNRSVSQGVCGCEPSKMLPNRETDSGIMYKGWDPVPRNRPPSKYNVKMIYDAMRLLHR